MSGIRGKRSLYDAFPIESAKEARSKEQQSTNKQRKKQKKTTGPDTFSKIADPIVQDPILRRRRSPLDEEISEQAEEQTKRQRMQEARIKRAQSNASFKRKEVNLNTRVHYDTVKLVHDPVYEHNQTSHLKVLKKINNYDPLAETKKRMKIEKAKSNKTGDQKLQDLKFWLDNLGLKRHAHQVRFHEQMILASLSKIYENEWETQYEQIMKRFNITKMKRELLFSCPRRFGKTFSVAIYCAAYMLSVPKCQVAVFSTGKRTAKKLMVLILSFLVNYPGFADCVKTKNQEDLVLSFGLNDDRILSCYPATVKVRYMFFYFFCRWQKREFIETLYFFEHEFAHSVSFFFHFYFFSVPPERSTMIAFASVRVVVEQNWHGLSFSNRPALSCYYVTLRAK